jgi:hypothetical protein
MSGSGLDLDPDIHLDPEPEQVPFPTENYIVFKDINNYFVNLLGG